jgi:hypothetical protein
LTEKKMLAREIQKRCNVQPGMLIECNVGRDERQPWVTALVVGLSPQCRFDEDYPEAAHHIIYMCQPLDGEPEFAEYAMNMKIVSK